VIHKCAPPHVWTTGVGSRISRRRAVRRDVAHARRESRHWRHRCLCGVFVWTEEAGNDAFPCWESRKLSDDRFRRCGYWRMWRPSEEVGQRSAGHARCQHPKRLGLADAVLARSHGDRTSHAAATDGIPGASVFGLRGANICRCVRRWPTRPDLPLTIIGQTRPRGEWGITARQRFRVVAPSGELPVNSLLNHRQVPRNGILLIRTEAAEEGG
jgi:hypothetical protein